MILLLACVDPPETGGDTDAGPDTHADTEPQALCGTVSLPEDTEVGAALTAALVAVAFGDGPVFSDTVASGVVSDAFELSLPEPGELVPVVPESELRAAFYAVVVFEDTNGDGAWTDEPLRGLAMDRWLVYLQGDTEWPSGWQLVDLGLEGQYRPNRCLADTTVPFGWREGYPSFYPVESGVSVLLRGLPASLRLGGSFGVLPEGATALAGVPYQQALDSSLGWAPVFEVPASGEFSVELTEEPPVEQDIGADPDWRYTLALNLVLTGTGVDTTTTCQDGNVVYTRYTRMVDNWRGYRFLDCYSGTVGWRAASADPDTDALVYLSSAEAATLSVDVACVW